MLWRRDVTIRGLLLMCAVALSVPAHAAEPDAIARREIAHLIEHLGASGCQFNRNGSWYDASRAVNHLQRKYEYLLDKGQIADTDAFIRLAATQSSASGKPYLVKCGKEPEMPSAAWFQSALAEFRAKTRK
jgi:hypothetical protein